MNLYKKKSNLGLSLVEVIVSIGIISMSSLIALMMMKYVGDGLSRSRNQETLTILKQKIINTITNQSSWDKTIAMNAAMHCRQTYPSSCVDNTNANIDLYDADGNKIIDSTSSGVYYRRDGSQCPTGSPLEECPVTISLGWKISCSTPEECKYPVDILKLTFYHDPTVEKKGFNSLSYDINWTSRKSLSDNSSPVITCAQSGKVFIGIGQHLTSTSGVIHNADSNGCVGLGAFKGPRGFMGALGPQGPQGPDGIAGPDGGGPPFSPIVIPAPTPIAIWCATSMQHTTVCNSFVSRLGRQPDLTSAEYYLDILVNGGTAAQIEHLMSTSIEALAQADAGVYSSPSAIGPHGIELGTDIYPGGVATTSIEGVSVAFTLPTGKKLTPEEAYAAYTTAAQAKGLDTHRPEVAGAIEKAVIYDVSTKIKNSH